MATYMFEQHKYITVLTEQPPTGSEEEKVEDDSVLIAGTCLVSTISVRFVTGISSANTNINKPEITGLTTQTAAASNHG